MLQESLGGGGESAASAKRALVQVQKLVLLASARPNALTLREYREGLEVGATVLTDGRCRILAHEL
jgi:hypothetical protein